MRNKIIVSLEAWILEDDTKDNPYKSIHLDSLKTYTEKKPRGLNLVKYVSSVLDEVRTIIEKQAKVKRVHIFRPLAYIPLMSSKDLTHWQDSNWEEVGENDEPPSIYLLPTSELFNNYVEEYRYPVKLPFEKNKLLALFRCVRDPQAIEKSWEFSRGIYVYFLDDF